MVKPRDDKRLTVTTTTNKPRILTGDTPTGRLHLGHYVGSIENRLRLQDSHDCFFIIANTHALTTRAEESSAVREDVLQITLDYLAAGIDPTNQPFLFKARSLPLLNLHGISPCSLAMVG